MAYKVQGASTLRRTLKRAGVAVQDLKEVHRDVADLVIRESKPDAPHRTGRLRESMRPASQQTQAIVRVGSSRVPYAGPIHWGWPRRNIRANPWVWEAAQESQPRWEKQYLEALEAIVNKIEGAPGP